MSGVRCQAVPAIPCARIPSLEPAQVEAVGGGLHPQPAGVDGHLQGGGVYMVHTCSVV